MEKITYPAFIEATSDGKLCAFLPDLPGCITAGHETVPEALESLAIGVVMHLEGMLEDGEAIPEPSHIEYVTVERPGA